MLIDWFTVVAQIINFLVLLALLKWLLFDRIVRAMDEREEKIASRLEEAGRKQDEAEEQVKKLEGERRRLDARREGMLRDARDEAEERRRELVRKAREEVDQLRHDWQRDLEQQQQRIIGDLSQRAGDALQRAVRQALTDLADADVQRGMIRVFLGRLEGLDGKKRETFGKAIQDSQGEVVVASAEELPEDARREIAEAIQHQFNGNVHAVFETSSELISGLEIRSHGQALGWSLRRYLDGFDETLGETLHEEAETAESLRTANETGTGSRLRAV
jgi:F-type H+-transporting ATPase subunit b